MKTRTEPARALGDRDVLADPTRAERRVSVLAAAGQTNREIAETLFLSVRTAETHLSHANQKLHVRSRTELALVVYDSHIVMRVPPRLPPG